MAGEQQQTLLWSVGALVLAIATLLGIGKRQRQILLQSLGLLASRKAGGGSSKASSSQKSNSRDATKNPYLNIFPLIDRERLHEVAGRLPKHQRQALGDLEFNKEGWSKSIMAYGDDYSTCAESKYTCTGFSAKEIRALGNFPDYATLSGVPLPKPYHKFNLENALPRPYRPMRWRYHQTMSIYKMEPDWWLELVGNYKQRLKERHAIYNSNPKELFRCLPGSEFACKEVMEMSLQFVAARYPQYFKLDEEAGIFENHILGTRQDVYSKHPLLILLDNIPEDYIIMMRNPETGYYQLRAAMILSAIGWNATTKLDMELKEIHAPVPDFKEKMQFSMDRYFANLTPDKSIQRGSWGFDVDEPLYEGPNDPALEYRKAQNPELELSRCFMRVDWQTLRRLPLSGAVVFNFKVFFTPATEFRTEPYIPSLILKLLKEGKEELMKYKGTWHTEHVIIPAMERYEKEQLEKGIIEKDWEHKTLAESPYFPGWEKKWHEQQGF